MSLNENALAVLAVVVMMVGLLFVTAGFNDAGDADNDTLFRVVGIAMVVASFLFMVWLTHRFYELNIGFMVGLVLLYCGLLLTFIDTSFVLDLLGVAAALTAVFITNKTHKRGVERGDWT